MNENVTKLRTDAEKAQDYREQVRQLLEPVCEAITKARNEGLIVGFNISPDQYGRSRVAEITVVKPL